MDSFNVADAKARFSELLERAGGGETVNITKRGKPIARLVPAEQPKIPVNVERLKALAAKSGWQDESAVDLIRKMRDERY